MANTNKCLYCSFCGKSQHEVRVLISGPSVFICNECSTTCEEIINERGRDGSGKLLPPANPRCQNGEPTAADLIKSATSETGLSPEEISLRWFVLAGFQHIEMTLAQARLAFVKKVRKKNASQRKKILKKLDHWRGKLEKVDQEEIDEMSSSIPLMIVEE